MLVQKTQEAGPVRAALQRGRGAWEGGGEEQPEPRWFLEGKATERPEASALSLPNTCKSVRGAEGTHLSSLTGVLPRARLHLPFLLPGLLSSS